MGYALMTKPGCVYSTRAKALLRSQKLTFSDAIYDTPERLQRFKDAGYDRFPQIFHDGVLVGGLDDLEQHLEA